MDTKTRPIYMLSTRDPLLTKGHIQTEREGMKKDIPCKWKSKESWSSNSHIRQNRLQNKDYYMRQRRTLHNAQGINPRRRYNNCKYLCTQHRSTSIHKANADNHKGEIYSNTIIVGDFTTTLSAVDKQPK